MLQPDGVAVPIAMYDLIENVLLTIFAQKDFIPHR
jgi:hypothetical protein